MLTFDEFFSTISFTVEVSPFEDNAFRITKTFKFQDNCSIDLIVIKGEYKLSVVIGNSEKLFPVKEFIQAVRHVYHNWYVWNIDKPKFPKGYMCDECVYNEGDSCLMTNKLNAYSELLSQYSNDETLLKKYNPSIWEAFAVEEPTYNDADDVSFCELFRDK